MSVQEMFGIREKKTKLMMEVNGEHWSTGFSAGVDYEIAYSGYGIGEYRCESLIHVLFSVLNGGNKTLSSPELTVNERDYVEIVAYTVGTDVREYRVITINQEFKDLVDGKKDFFVFERIAKENLHLLKY